MLSSFIPGDQDIWRHRLMARAQIIHRQCLLSMIRWQFIKDQVNIPLKLQIRAICLQACYCLITITCFNWEAFGNYAELPDEVNGKGLKCYYLYPN